MDELKMNNAPQWADYVVVYSQERAKVTGLGRSTRYFKSLEKAAAYAAQIDEVVLKVKSEMWTSIGGLKPADPGKERRGNKMNEYGQYGSWEEMDQAREHLADTFEDPDVREHVRERAAFRPRRRGWWLPAVWSENDPVLRDKLLEDLGPTRPSGYMSEECGWEIQEP